MKMTRQLLAAGRLFRRIAFLASVAGALAACGADASWIWYPGDYALWRGNDLQSRRIEFGGGYPVFWASYAAHPLVDFTKTVDLKAPEEVDIAWEGVCRITGKGLMPGVVSNRYVFPAGKYTITARVYSQGRPPALYVNGATIKTDSSWRADWRVQASGLGGIPAPPAETRAAFDAPSKRPAVCVLETKPAEAASVKTIHGNHLFADFGRETFGFLKLLGVSGKGKVRIVYGESEPEALCVDPEGTDQWEILDVGPGESFRTPVARGWRYVQVIPLDGVSVRGVSMDEQLCPLARAGAFRCSDPLVNRIWDVSARTLEITTREIFIEGAKPAGRGAGTHARAT